MNAQTIETRRGVHVRVFEAGSAQAQPLVFLHGVLGLLSDNTFLELLAERYHVLAPELPGYGESSDEEQLEDMLDFTLHGWDVVEALHVDSVGETQRTVEGGLGHAVGDRTPRRPRPASCSPCLFPTGERHPAPPAEGGRRALTA